MSPLGSYSDIASRATSQHKVQRIILPQRKIAAPYGVLTRQCSYLEATFNLEGTQVYRMTNIGTGTADAACHKRAKRLCRTVQPFAPNRDLVRQATAILAGHNIHGPRETNPKKWGKYSRLV